jgi:hypothetical protein
MLQRQLSHLNGRKLDHPPSLRLRQPNNYSTLNPLALFPSEPRFKVNLFHIEFLVTLSLRLSHLSFSYHGLLLVDSKGFWRWCIPLSIAYPSSGILNNTTLRKLELSQSSSGRHPTLLCPLENLSHWITYVGRSGKLLLALAGPLDILVVRRGTTLATKGYRNSTHTCRYLSFFGQGNNVPSLYHHLWSVTRSTERRMTSLKPDL